MFLLLPICFFICLVSYIPHTISLKNLSGICKEYPLVPILSMKDHYSSGLLPPLLLNATVNKKNQMREIELKRHSYVTSSSSSSFSLSICLSVCVCMLCVCVYVCMCACWYYHIDTALDQMLPNFASWIKRLQ